MERNRLKKRIVAVMLIMVIVLAVLWTVSIILDKVDKNAAEPEIPVVYYDFYTPNFEADIFEESNYLEKDRQLYYTDDMGQQIGYTKNNITENDLIPEFFINYFDAIAHADKEKYLSCFSAEYREKIGDIKDFTMQRVYNMEVELISCQSLENGESVAEVTCNYRIMKNDGTFRNDIGSDMGRVQYMTLSIRDENIEISSVRTQYKVEK